jgi:hypothetical protein
VPLIHGTFLAIDDAVNLAVRERASGCNKADIPLDLPVQAAGSAPCQLHNFAHQSKHDYPEGSVTSDTFALQNPNDTKILTLGYSKGEQ